MKTIMNSIFFFLFFSTFAFTDVRLHGELTILESYSGSTFLGEILNDTNSPIEFVQITITSKDSDGKVIDVSNGYCDGFYDGYYVPIGGVVPFKFYGDVSPSKISSYSHVISYRTTDVAPDNYVDVKLNGEITILKSFSGAEFIGEIINKTNSLIEFVKITITSKDVNGKVIDVSFGYCDGYYDGNYVPAGGIVPFDFYGYVTPDSIKSYTVVISYTTINLSPPTDVVATDVSNDNGHCIMISWTPSTDEEIITHYTIYRSRNQKLTEPLTLEYFNSLESLIKVEQDSTILVATVPKAQNNYTDSCVPVNGVTYYYWVQAESTTNNKSEKVKAEYVTTTVDNTVKIPSEISISGNYPNPFNMQTCIEFYLPNDCKINIDIYNILGQRIRILISEYFSAGKHTIIWDGYNYKGLKVNSGIYIAQLSSDSHVTSHRMMLLK